MILAFHSIFSVYGFWLPNDERGSWSTWVASWELFRFGPATKVDVRHSVAKRPYDRAKRLQMRSVLRHAPVRFSGEQAQIIGTSLRKVPYPIHALAVMHDHVHLVVGRIDRATFDKPSDTSSRKRRGRSGRRVSSSTAPSGAITVGTCSWIRKQT